MCYKRILCNICTLQSGIYICKVGDLNNLTKKYSIYDNSVHYLN